ncbi:MAG: ABC transporter permease subunit [Phycisphaerales bacterium]
MSGAGDMGGGAPTPGVSSGAHKHQRRTPMAAHGEPLVWLMGAALIACLVLILGLLGVIAYKGGATFWPGRIDRVTMRDGEVFLGVPMGSQAYEPGELEQQRIAELRAKGELPQDAIKDDGRAVRRRYRVGNRDLGQESFRWAPVYEIERVERHDDALLVERREWGVFLGEPQGAYRERVFERAAGETGEPEVPTGVVRTEQEVRETRPDGTEVVRERLWVAEGAGQTLAALGRLHAEAEDRRERIEEINDREIPRLQERLVDLEWDRRAARMRAEAPRTARLATPIWIGLCLAGIGTLVLGLWSAGLIGGGAASRGKRRVGAWAWAVTAGLALAVVLEAPWSAGSIDAERLARLESRLDAKADEIRARQKTLLAQVERLREEDARWRLLVVDPRTERFSPRSQSEPDEPMLISQVVRVVRANQLGAGGRVGVYLARWGEFLSADPRENASEGGVFPVIIGTVTLTLLLTVTVTPLGVIAAIYLREYARQGLVTSMIRIAVNNLAGVPSIVYGMFGLGFFCYALGGYIDAGPSRSFGRPAWWALIGGLVVMLGLAATLSALGAKRPGRKASASNRIAGALASGLWLGVVALVVVTVAHTPYFHGFFAERLPESPTFGGRGILWASLTLALLTLPVVIVATEEAISAVPQSMREGSLAAGATRWQTIRRIVLPSALPGIMTGAILAMARGAGEVAPLMLVGAVNLAPALPVTTDAPFLHAERTFMHLGFHIYNLGFQSPDSEATEPLVWTTTLLLVTIVLVLNLGAILIRGRLRRRSGGAAV